MISAGIISISCLKNFAETTAPIGIDKIVGVRKAIPATPSLRFTLTISLLEKVKYLLLTNCPFNRRFSALCNIRLRFHSSILVLKTKKKVTPVLPPAVVIITVSQKV